MIKPNRNARRKLASDNKKWSVEFVEIPENEWPIVTLGVMQPFKVMRNDRYLVLMYPSEGIADIRLSICRTTMNSEGLWDDKITWDELQQIKSDIGHGNSLAVEVYPPDYDVVNVANMRHLWLITLEPFDIGWRK